MHIASLKTTNFRNLNGVELQFVPEVNVFHGLNGSGKTNLLEALHVCCLGKSQRGAQDQTMVRSQTDVYRLECALQEDDRRKEVAVAAQRGGRKKVEIDGVTSRLRDLYEQFQVVSVGPEDSEIVAGSPSNRRGFLDIYISQRSARYLSTLSDYQRCLQQRNAALKAQTDPSPFDDLFIDLGVRVMTQRAEFVTAIKPLACDHYARISGGGSFDVSYAPSVAVDSSDEDTWADSFGLKLAEISHREAAYGSSLAGPHRDDVVLTVNDHPARTHASQGECRTAAISLKLAAYHVLKEDRGLAPILLLDEIFAELDDRRTGALIEAFADFGQLFLTTATDPPHALANSGRAFEISNGQVSEVR